MINQPLYEFLSLDLPPLLCSLFACMSCALLGNFLVLRKISLMGDAISHSVLPGIVGAFLFSGSRTGMAVFIGAALAGILSSVLVEAVRVLGRLEAGAAMGVVFSVMFATGVVLIEQAAARNVDLDADCLLHGQLETIFWYPPRDFSNWQLSGILSALPAEVSSSFWVFILCIAFVGIFFKELTIGAFDPALATALGFNASVIHYALMIVVAAAVVASFAAVGSILVVAMIICPAATARFYTDRLLVQITLSLIFCALAVTGGYWLAGFAPLLAGFENALSAGGSMTVLSGVILLASAIFAPGYGILARQLRVLALSVKVRSEDILADLYRAAEESSYPKAAARYSERGLLTKVALYKLKKSGLIEAAGSKFSLTEDGLSQAQSLIRTHRLWESFLVERAGVQPDHVHQSAEKLEHHARERLLEVQSHSKTDPHGKPIP